MNVLVSLLNHSRELTGLCEGLMADWPVSQIKHEDCSGEDLKDAIHQRRIRYDCDFCIALDEDVFVFDQQALWETIEYMQGKGCDYAGMPEQGVSSHRFAGKEFTNSYFMIFNNASIKAKGIKADQTYFDVPKPREEYWRVFRAMDGEGAKRLGLKGHDHSTDPITTVLEGFNGKPMLYHTWYAREFISPRHHDRIMARYREVKELCNK